MPLPNTLMKWTLSRGCFWLLLLCLAVAAHAQLHIPLLKKDKDKTYDPDTVAGTLRNADAKARNDLAAELRIMAPDPSNPSAVSDAPCTTFNQVDEKKLRLRPDADNALIIAYSSQCDSTYLIAFEHENKAEWKHLHTLRLASRIQKPEISYADMVEPGVSEILVHRETTRDTGGTEQENFVVIKLLHDRLVPVLDAVERLDVVLPVLASDDSDTVEQSQTATFKIVQNAPKSGALSRVLERNLLSERKISIALYRTWSWDPDLERFRWAPTSESDLAQWARPKKPTPATKSAAANPSPKTVSQAAGCERLRNLAHPEARRNSSTAQVTALCFATNRLPRLCLSERLSEVQRLERTHS